MICSKCGSAMDDNAKTCPSCGSPVVEVHSVSADGKSASGSGRAAVTVVFSILFGILIFICITAAVILGTLSASIDSGKLVRSIAETDITQLKIGELVIDNQLSFTIKGKEYSYKDISEDTTLAEYATMLFSEYELSEEEVTTMGEKLRITDLVEDVVKSYENYIMNDEAFNVVTVDRLISIVNDCEQYIEKEFPDIDVNFSDAGKVLEENRDNLNMFSPEKALGGIGETTSVLLSMPVIIAAWAVVVVLTALIMLIGRGPSAGLITCGICAVLSGGVLLIVTSIYQSFLTGIQGYKFLTDMLTDIIENAVAADLRIYSIIILIAGVVILGGGIVVKVLMNKKRRT